MPFPACTFWNPVCRWRGSFCWQCVPIWDDRRRFATLETWRIWSFCWERILVQGWRENQSCSIQVYLVWLLQNTEYPSIFDRVERSVLQKWFWVVSCVGQNSRSAAFSKKGSFSLLSDKLETHLVLNELWHVLLVWYLQPGYLYVDCIYERHWPLVKQKMTQAAQVMSWTVNVDMQAPDCG